MTPEVKMLVLDLFEINTIQLGHFTLKSGLTSPIYIDIRPIISYPILLKKMSSALWTLARPLSFDLICGVPYTALPIATALSLDQNIPMILRRKELKEYGTKKNVEGVFQPGNTCLIIEDVVTSASSILETVECLAKEHIKVKDAIAILNRGQGGKERLKEQGICLHSLIDIHELLTLLFHENRISETTFRRVTAELKANPGHLQS